jgi:TetR/AcrR family transcriptional regulator, transcriptional repressor for nem operon
METTKQQILAKAFGLFLSFSYREVTLNKLLKETGISRGAFYHHFGSKEELFAEVVEQFFFAASEEAGFTPSPDAGFAENMTHFLDSKQQAFKWFASRYGVDENQLNFFLFIVEAIRHLPGVREKFKGLVEHEAQQVKSILQAAAARGEFRPDADLDFLARHIVKAFDGYEMHGVLLGQFPETIGQEKEMVNQLHNLFQKP